MANYHSYTRKCSNCGNEFKATRVDAHLCSATCRKAWSRIPESLDAAYFRAVQAVEEIRLIHQRRWDLRNKCDAIIQHLQELTK